MSFFHKLRKSKNKVMGFIIASVVIIAVAGASKANAQTTTDGGCNISSSPLYFGSYSPFGTSDIYSSSNISLSCSTYVPTIILKMNPNFITGDLVIRHMKNMSKVGTGREYELSYSLFTNYDRNIVWGNGLSNTDVLIVKLNDNKVGNVNFYGTLYKGQNVYTGVYSDSTTIEIEY